MGRELGTFYVKNLKVIPDEYTYEAVQWYEVNLEDATTENTDFRRVVKTTPYHQIVLMSIEDDIGEEVHYDTNQFIRVESGSGLAIIDGKEYALPSEGAINIERGRVHNIKNVGEDPLKLYSIYSPPHHPKGLIQQTKYK